jgi:Zn-dependent protease
VPVNSISLYIFGGVAQIAHEPHSPEAEFRIVAAGPFASLALAAFFAAAGAAPIMHNTIRTAADYLGQVNLILAVFNLIPGFPLDGGRLLRAGLWKWSRDYTRATRWAILIGLGIAGLFIAAGLGLAIFDHLASGLWLAFSGWYLGRTALHHSRQDIGEETPESPRLPGRLAESTERTAGSPAYQFLPAPDSTGIPGKGKVQL